VVCENKNIPVSRLPHWDVLLFVFQDLFDLQRGLVVVVAKPLAHLQRGLVVVDGRLAHFQIRFDRLCFHCLILLWFL